MKKIRKVLVFGSILTMAVFPSMSTATMTTTDPTPDSGLVEGTGDDGLDPMPAGWICAAEEQEDFYVFICASEEDITESYPPPYWGGTY